MDDFKWVPRIPTQTNQCWTGFMYHLFWIPIGCMMRFFPPFFKRPLRYIFMKIFRFYAIWIYIPRKNLHIQVQLPWYQYDMRMALNAAGTTTSNLQSFSHLALSTKFQYVTGTGRPGQFIDTMYSSIYNNPPLIRTTNEIRQLLMYSVLAPCIWLTYPQLQPWFIHVEQLRN